MAAANRLPSLAEGRVGGLAFFAVCGLLAAAAGVFGLSAYSTIREIIDPLRDFEGEFLAGALRNMLFESGILVGLAAIVYLIAPPGEEEEAAEGERASQAAAP